MSLGIYVVLYFLSPLIPVVSARKLPDQVRQKEFKFRLLHPEEVEQLRQREQGEPGDEARPLSTRPGAVRDLLKRSDESLETSPLDNPIQPLDQLASRSSPPVASTASAGGEALRRADLRILEISQAEARSEIDVTRRLVRPSDERMLPDGAMPVLRVAVEADAPIHFGPVGQGLLAAALQATGGAQGALVSLGESNLAPVDSEVELMEVEKRPVPIEIARQALREEQSRARDGKAYVFLDDLVDISLATHREPGEELGYFRIRVSPKTGSSIPAAPKAVTFVIDASSSIQQRKLDLTGRVVVDAINALSEVDRFNVVIFRDTLTLFRPQLTSALSAEKAAARAFLKSLPSKGETNVYAALSSVMTQRPDSGEAGIIVVLSDGRPTAGARDARAIINGATEANALANSVFAFGAGNTVNRYMLELLGYRNKGAASVVPDIQRLPASFSAFFKTFSQPILVEVAVDYSGIDKRNIYPALIPNFYSGRPLDLYGRYLPGRDVAFSMRITGRAASVEKDIVYRADLESANPGGIEIAQQWAFEKSYALIAQISDVGEQPELVSELRSISKRYGVKTVYSE